MFQPENEGTHSCSANQSDDDPFKKLVPDDSIKHIPVFCPKILIPVTENIEMF